MTYRVRISEQADADLRGIYEYIAFHLRVLYSRMDIDHVLDGTDR